jgi:hypothetical protein
MEPATRIYEWEARIAGGVGDGSGAFVGFPWDLRECFGKANLVPVQVEFDGIPYRGSIANMGTGPCIGLLKDIRAKLGKQHGDTVKVRLWLDTEPRVVEAPEDLAAALTGTPAAQAVWDKLSTSHRREYAKWIEEAKKAETRSSRVAKALALLQEGKKLK